MRANASAMLAYLLPKSSPFKWLGRLEEDGAFVFANNMILMHRVGTGHFEVYWPASSVWIQIPPTTHLYPQRHEGTLIYRLILLGDSICYELGALIRRLHHRMANFEHYLVTEIPARYLIDDYEEEEEDYDLITIIEDA
ncbi:hypothetical protein B0H17DRAFT_1151312 [Mycena rosella]|uniref:Uncharacterized protein n=1 Tax=Mycena rosella TaxID=1033263 RepID=A0AAD7FKF4_MYCRO|nr:hypothetical protein B0H17DRAFT_1151312 [Mycena rosella]